MTYTNEDYLKALKYIEDLEFDRHPATVAIIKSVLSKQVTTLVKGITLTDYGLIGVCPCCGACVRTLNDNNNVCRYCHLSI